jgi:hypothetical protein
MKNKIIINLDRVYNYKTPSNSQVEVINKNTKLYYDIWTLYQKTGHNLDKTLRTVIKVYQSDSFKLENILRSSEDKGFLTIDNNMVLGSGLVND